MNNNWEEIEKKARILEIEIDMKLIGLNKINSSSGVSNYNDVQNQNAYGQNAIFGSLTADIEDQISKLSKIIDEMKHYMISYTSEHNKNTLNHMLRRHTDLLTDYSSEFSRTCSNIRNKLEREELLELKQTKDTDSFLNNRMIKSTDFLLRENESINSCDRLLNEQISIALTVKENVHGQGNRFHSINRQLHLLTKKYPAINTLMQKIRMKKRKDTFILAAVISTCLIFFFIYIMH